MAEQALIYEIHHTARRILEARDPHGQPIYRTDGVFQVLDAVARAPYCMAIADLGRVLRIRKQSAQQFAHAAAREGVIDLEPNPDDKRLLQLLMTPKGRAVLEEARRTESDWLMLLLHGLGDRELEATTHVILVMRQRLARDARVEGAQAYNELIALQPWGSISHMRRTNRLAAASVLSAAAVWAAGIAAQPGAQSGAQPAAQSGVQPAAAPPGAQPASRPPTPPPKFTAAELTAAPTSGWITNGGNVYNQRYSPLTQINRDTVGDLKPIWRTRLNGSGTDSKYSGQAQPLVYDGVIYIPTGANDVFALSADTGEILWVHEAHLDPNITVICCGWMSRGVALGEGKVFSGQLDGKLVALDAKNGEVVWSVQAETNDDGFSITSAPLYYDGLVITGFAGGDRASRGRVKAYDARDGKLVWTFYTIPGPGEFGHDTWPSYNDTWEYGGAAVWQTPAVDPELGLVYFSTGNPGPDLNGSVRPGNNLFSVSMVAIEAKTGRYRWHFQQVRHDLWDYDSPNPVVLFDAVYDGRPRKGIVEIGKTGYVYILDRVTGEPLVGMVDTPVPQEPRQATAATQPIPIGDEVIPHEIDIEPEGFKLINNGRIFTPFWDEPVVVKPLGTGGANWPPSSYDPETNLFYVCVGDGAAAYSTKEGGAEWVMPQPGGRYFGGDYTRSRVPRRGVVAAVDVRTNRLAWRQQWGELCYAGSTVTAGGLLFIGRNDGRLTAHDKADGALLWEYQTDAGIHAAVTTFERNGKQYVVANSAGSFFPGTTRGDSVYMFALDGAAAAPSGGTAAPASGAGTELEH